MKKKLLITLTTLGLCFLIGCSPKTETEIITETEVEVQNYYVTDSRYFTNGKVITPDGNEWRYKTDLISEQIPYDNMPVWVGFSDNGTEDITDDIILGLVYDKETAIYDKLEQSFSEVEDWEITRNGNDIHIEVK